MKDHRIENVQHSAALPITADLHSHGFGTHQPGQLCILAFLLAVDRPVGAGLLVEDHGPTFAHRQLTRNVHRFDQTRLRAAEDADQYRICRRNLLLFISTDGIVCDRRPGQFVAADDKSLIICRCPDQGSVENF